jgi:hypothetical protein
MRKTATEGFGSSEGTATEYFTADRSCTESSIQWTKGMMKTMTGGKVIGSASIVRLDKQLVWSVDHKEKEYREMTFEEFREMLKKANEQMESAASDMPADTAAEELYEWKVETLSSPDPKTINGFNCRNVKMVATGTNKQDSNDRVMITFDLWNSLDVPGADDMKTFGENFAHAIGLKMDDVQPGLMQAIALYKTQFEKLAEEAKKAPGMSVTSLMEIRRNQLVGPKVGKMMKEGMKQEVMGKLPFGKKKEPKVEEPKYEERVKFSVSTELTEAKSGALDGSLFEVPAGYKLKKK